MYYYNVFLFLLLTSHVFADYEQDTSTSTADVSDPVNQDIYNAKELFTRDPNVTDVNSVVQVRLYCEIDEALCINIQTALISAATRLSQVIIFKNQIV